jgi:hypothetical protein
VIVLDTSPLVEFLVGSDSIAESVRSAAAGEHSRFPTPSTSGAPLRCVASPVVENCRTTKDAALSNSSAG